MWQIIFEHNSFTFSIMIELIVLGITLLFIGYYLMTIALIAGWYHFPKFNDQASTEGPLYSIIVPVRNEAANILQLLTDFSQQHYRNFEVIIVNDHSDDDTVKLVENHAANFPLRLLHLGDKGLSSPKKAAISLAIQSAEGALIVTTDGDCRANPAWLSTINAFYDKHRPVMISAGVSFYEEQGWFEQVQTVEFMSLIGAGAISMHLGSPNMCNGANLIYEKAAYEAVSGFEGSEHLASGDDEFLMHKLAAHYPKRVRFLKAAKATITTKAQESFTAFVHQRKRWASKWNHYDNWQAMALAIFVYAFHLAHVISLGFLLFSPPHRELCAYLITGKFLLELIYLSSLLDFFEKRAQIKWIPLTAILYSFYILAIGALGQLGSYQWKDRKLR